MIVRTRGDDHELQWGRWRPPSRAQPLGAGEPATRPSSRLRRWRPSPQRLTRWLVLLVVAGGAYSAVGGAGWFTNSTKPTLAVMPATPRAWLDAYDAAAVDDPARVCSQLFAAPLAAAYARAAHGSCARYFARVTVASVRVWRVLQAGNTAVLELRQVIKHQAWAVVLHRRPEGWQAVDVMDGRLIR
jgi:hypothetical protein